MILIDVDTQIDFLLPAGALYVPGAERLLAVYEEIFRKVRERSIPVLSSVDAHVENDPEFAHWPPHCVKGTLGQQKAPCTLAGEQQVVVEKQTLDIFSNPHWETLLARHPGEECVVIGVATDYCVRHAVDGLLDRGRQVAVVTDAIRGIDAAASERLLEGWRARGARLIASSAI
jgi:nicotinamidase/pyrazinamidase